MTGHPALADDEFVRTSRDQRGPRTDTSSLPPAMLLDDLLDHYVDWRESARAVTHGHARPGARDSHRICSGGDRRRAVAAALGVSSSALSSGMQQRHPSTGDRPQIVRAMRCGLPTVVVIGWRDGPQGRAGRGVRARPGDRRGRSHARSAVGRPNGAPLGASELGEGADKFNRGRPTPIPRLEADRGLRRVRATNFAERGL